MIILFLRYVPRKQTEETSSDDFQMKNGLSNTNFKSDSEF